MKNKKNKKTAKVKKDDSEIFVNAVSSGDNIKAKKFLTKIVQNKCERRFKKILADEKNDK